MSSSDKTAATSKIEKPSDFPKKINLGCGDYCAEGFLGVDQYDNDAADLQIDLDSPVWKELPSNHFSYIKSVHCIEHLQSWKNAFQEISRIAENGATVEIRVPHFSFDGSPDHEHSFGVFFPDYFLTGEDREWIRSCKFKVKERHLRWRAKSNYEREGNSKSGLFLNALGRLLNPLIEYVIPLAIAERFATLFAGFEEIEWVMEVEK